MGQYKVKADTTIDRHSFIRLVADEAGFTIRDTKDFWRAAERVIARCIENRFVLNIYGFGKFYVKQIDEFEGWDGINKKRILRPPSERIVFSPATTLSKIKNNSKEIHYDIGEQE